MYDTKRMNNELKWSNSLRIQMDDNLWERVYTIYRECTLQSKLRSFQYKLLHRALPTRVELYRYGIIDNELCVFCHLDRETLEHLFGDCPYVQDLWQALAHILSPCIDLFFIFDEE